MLGVCTFCTMGMMAFAQADDALGTIREVFPDENLAQVMAVTLNKSVEDIVTRGELEHVGYIDGANCGIKSLEGMQYISKASHVYLSGNSIADLRPLKNLKEVTEVHGVKSAGRSFVWSRSRCSWVAWQFQTPPAARSAFAAM